MALRPKAGHETPFLRFFHHTQRRITVGRIPLAKGSVRRRDLYLTKHNTHNRPTISAGERPQNYAFFETCGGQMIGINEERQAHLVGFY